MRRTPTEWPPAPGPIQPGCDWRRKPLKELDPGLRLVPRGGPYSAASTAGNEISTSVPWSRRLLIENSAPLASTSALVSGRPRPTPPLRPPRAHLAERLERHADLVLVHADPGVAHPDDRLARGVERGRDDHLAAGLVELHRVRHEVQHDLLQRPLVDHHLGQPVVQRHPHDDPLARGLRLHERNAVADEAVGVDGGEGELELARLDLAEIEEVVGEAHDVPARGVDVLEIVAVAVVADRPEPLLHHHLGEPEDGVERRADLVADVGEMLGLGGAAGERRVAGGRQPALGFAFAPHVAEERAEMRRFGRADAGERQREVERRAVMVRPTTASGGAAGEPSEARLSASSPAVAAGWLGGARSMRTLSPATSLAA